MDINYKEIADRAAAYGKELGVNLDFSEKSIEDVDWILQQYYERRSEYEGEEGSNTFWNIAVHFGIYLGETLLRQGLKELGYDWHVSEGMPVLRRGEGMEMSPLSKVHKRMLYGPQDDVQSFCDVAFAVAKGEDFPTNKVLRAVDVKTASGRTEQNVLRQEIDDYVMMVADGEEDFLILSSHDGYLQFYGVDDRFVAEVRVNLPDKDFRTFAVADRNKLQAMDRISLTTPYGQFTPRERDVVPLAVLREVVRAYYANVDTDRFLEEIPCAETTEEMKRCMGLL